MRFRMYPRSFPFAMLSIMRYGKNVLRTQDEDEFNPNDVQIESDGLIDPYLEQGAGTSDGV